MRHFAHSLDRRPASDWEPLADHLHAVAGRAADFAAVFDAAGWGLLAGRWHDLGKYSDAFQARLRGGASPDHAAPGTRHALDAAAADLGNRVLAAAIAGHHAGLADWRRSTDPDAPAAPRPLAERLAGDTEDCPAVPPYVAAAVPLPLPPRLLAAVTADSAANDAGRAAFRVAFFGRMLFSALCDADFLETERFYVNAEPPAGRSPRPSGGPTVGELAGVLDEFLHVKTAAAEPTPVNARRAEILAACRRRAADPPGLFSLTVPTGGGKTLSGLAFALNHAAVRGLRRVVTAVPFTSITGQTAGVYREVFARLGPDVVLEHHSAREVERDTPTTRLAAENWEAPVVVTTNAQLLESLFAGRPGKCRKLHRLANSVIVLDEAQALPPGLLAPCLRALAELVEVYGCTVVLCTATQPALERRDEFPVGLSGVTEIAPHPPALYSAMRRVRCEWVGDLPDGHLAAELADRPQALCVVNTRRHAAAVWDATRDALGLDEDGCEAAGLIHLSTNLCAAHRAERLNEVRRRLRDDEPCRVVSTQLIEAGVDVNFPAVWRAVCGLDSAAQAAGRCNREGRAAEGVLTLFEPVPSDEVKTVVPRGMLAAAADVTRELIASGQYPDLLAPAAVRRFFELFLWRRERGNGWDDPGVLGCFTLDHTAGDVIAQYATAAAKFRLIADDQTPVYVPWGADGRALLNRLRHGPPDRALVRKLRRFAVGVYDRHFDLLRAAGDVEDPHAGTENAERFWLLANPDLYDARLGLRTDRPGWLEPETLVV